MDEQQLGDEFACLMVRRDDAGNVTAAPEKIAVADLPPGDVLIEVAYSSLNYKDALACQAHPGVVRKLPHVPGIDAAGRVVESDSVDFQPGDQPRWKNAPATLWNWNHLSASR